MIYGEYYEDYVEYRGKYYLYNDNSVVYVIREGYHHVDECRYSERCDEYILDCDAVIVTIGEREDEILHMDDSVTLCTGDIVSDDDRDLTYDRQMCCWLYDEGDGGFIPSVIPNDRVLEENGYYVGEDFRLYKTK